MSLLVAIFTHILVIDDPLSLISRLFLLVLWLILLSRAPFCSIACVVGCSIRCFLLEFVVV